MREYQVRLRKDHRGVNLISDALPFGRLSYGEPDAVSNAAVNPAPRPAIRGFDSRPASCILLIGTYVESRSEN